MTTSSPRDPAAGPLAVARELLYAPLPTEALNARAARRIAEAIGVGLLDVGDRLPAEAELARRFGIAPMTLREALSLLRDAGYIETRRGRGGGNFVRAVHPRPRSPSPDDRIRELSLAELRDLGDAREAVEGAVAALAAQRIASENIAALQALLETMADTPDFRDFSRLDRRFHITLAASAGSRRLTELITQIQAELGEVLFLAPDPAESLGFTNGQHRAILTAVVRGDADGARDAMVAHIRDTTDYMMQVRLGATNGTQPRPRPAAPAG